MKIGQVDIENIEIDMSCRDGIPQLLLRLQTIYSNKQIRNVVFAFQTICVNVFYLLLISFGWIAGSAPH